MTTATIQSVDPRTGAPVGDAVPETDRAALESVLGRAAEAAPAFGRSTPGVRAALLRALPDALDAAADELVPLPVADVVATLRGKAGRLVCDGWPTGVGVTWAMHHGGPWPATTSAGFTSVGATPIQRWIRPVCYQDIPESLLPAALRTANPWWQPRRIDDRLVVAD